MTEQEWNRLTKGERAWKLGLVMQYMNNEEAYYSSGWLYIWPDGEDYPGCLVDFEDEENYNLLEEAFKDCYGYKEYHEDGLYSCRPIPTEVIDTAHFWDKKLGLKPIEIIK